MQPDSHGGRRPLEPGLKLAVTLRHMATGNSYKSLEYGFRVPHNTISLFVPEVCRAIIDEFQFEVLVDDTVLQKASYKYALRM